MLVLSVLLLPGVASAQVASPPGPPSALAQATLAALRRGDCELAATMGARVYELDAAYYHATLERQLEADCGVVPMRRGPQAAAESATSRRSRRGLTFEVNVGGGYANDGMSPAADLALGGWVTPRLALSLRLAAVKRERFVDFGSSGTQDRTIVNAFVGPSLQYWMTRHFWIAGGAGLATYDVVSGCVGYDYQCGPNVSPGLDLRAGYSIAKGADAVNLTIELLPNGLVGGSMAAGAMLLVGYQYGAAPLPAVATDRAPVNPRPIRSRRPVLLALAFDGLNNPSKGGKEYGVPSARLGINLSRRWALVIGAGSIIFTSLTYAGAQLVVADSRTPGRDLAGYLFARAGAGWKNLGDSGRFQTDFKLGGAGLELATAGGFTAFAELAVGVARSPLYGPLEGPGSHAGWASFGLGYRFGGGSP